MVVQPNLNERSGPVSPELYGQTSDGQDVHRVTLGGGQVRVRVLTYGGVIERLEAPDRDGCRANLVLGLDGMHAYETRSMRFGALIGRFANRIAGGRFMLDGVDYRLACNNGPNSIHGGIRGFDKTVWTIDSLDDRRIVLAYTSRDGEEGFPGTLRVRVAYSVDGDALRIGYRAETDRPTVLNLTNHSYFNLGGEGSGSVLDHVLQVEADHFAPTDASGVPTGEMRPVTGTPFDFREPLPIGARIRVADEQVLLGRGYDHHFVLRPGAGLRRAATVQHPGSGRRLEVWTTEPGVQVYTGNMLAGTLAGASGRIYRQGDGLCLETQHVPDSPNQPAFPSTVLRPGAAFESATEYRFTA